MEEQDRLPLARLGAVDHPGADPDEPTRETHHATLEQIRTAGARIFCAMSRLGIDLVRSFVDLVLLAAGAAEPLGTSATTGLSALQNFVSSLTRADGVTYAAIIATCHIVASTIPSARDPAVNASERQ